MVNSLTMSLPLAFEPKAPGLMAMPPQRSDLPLLNRPLLRRLLLVSAFSWVVIFAMFFWAEGHYGDRAIARTMAVQALVLSRVAYLISLSEVAHDLPWRWGKLLAALWRTPALLLGLGCALLLQVLSGDPADDPGGPRREPAGRLGSSNANERFNSALTVAIEGTATSSHQPSPSQRGQCPP